MDDKTMPNQASNKHKAEGERDTGGITNRPLEEEEKNQERVPDRGDSREGAHAGHGDDDRGSDR